jgi:hypothetical protein
VAYKYDYQPATQGRYWNLPEQTTTGIVIHSIGCPQPRAQVLVNNFNKATATASVHGFVEPGLYIETAPTRPAKRKAKKCYHVGGNWNNSRIGIEMTEPSSIQYTGGASFKDLNPENTKRHIVEVTATMAEVAADICIFHDIDVAMISTHAEAYRLGQGSNHGDPDHIWRYIGYSIAQFRLDVQKIINEKKGDFLSNMTKQEFEAILDAKFAEFEKKFAPVNYKYVADVPEWGRPSVQKCIDNGFMSGTGKEPDGRIIVNISADLLRVIVLNDRLGLYDVKDTVVETK